MELPSGESAPANGFLEWEAPADPPPDWPSRAAEALRRFHRTRRDRQQEIDAAIARSADQEIRHDLPFEDKGRVRVAGPFTVESVSPHRTLAVGMDEEPLDFAAEPRLRYGDGGQDFSAVALEHLRRAGVDRLGGERIAFSEVERWPGDRYLCATATYEGKGGATHRAGIFVGPEFGTVSRPDLVAAAKEAAEADCHVLVACAFSFDAHTTDLSNHGKVQILKARMNADLHMAGDLKNTGAGNLFVVFGEPDIGVEDADNGQIRVQIRGVDIYDPAKMEVRRASPREIACWFVDTDYDEEAFRVCHAYFPGASKDPYQALRTTLRAEIDEEAWKSLKLDVSRPFDRPTSGRIAVKAINCFGDEVMRVLRVPSASVSTT